MSNQGKFYCSCHNPFKIRFQNLSGLDSDPCIINVIILIICHNIFITCSVWISACISLNSCSRFRIFCSCCSLSRSACSTSISFLWRFCSTCTRMHTLNLSSIEIWCEILSHAVHSCIEFSAQAKSIRIIVCFTHQDKIVIRTHTHKNGKQALMQNLPPPIILVQGTNKTLISLHRLNITDDDIHNKLYLKVIILGCDMYLLQGTF